MLEARSTRDRCVILHPRKRGDRLVEIEIQYLNRVAVEGVVHTHPDPRGVETVFVQAVADVHHLGEDRAA